jgi:hypothetical protein
MRRFAAPALLLLLAAAAGAQNSAGDLSLRMYVKPEGARLHVLIRGPLSGLSGVALPYRSANGELDLARTEAMLPSVARWWIADRLEVYQNNLLLPKPDVAASRISLPSDNAFGSYDEARRRVLGAKLAEGAQVFREQAMFDVLFDYPIHEPSNTLAIRSRLSELAPRVTTALQFLPPAGPARNFEYTGDPGLFYLDPSWTQTVQRFTNAGVWQVLRGTDYLLFLFCLALELRGMALVSFAGVFAGVQAITLILSAYGFAVDALWFPVCIEALIALSILYLTLEIIAGRPLAQPRWAVAIVTGALFGYGFYFGLKPERQFAGQHELVATLSLDLGLGAGASLALALLAGALTILFRFAISGRFAPRTEKIVLAVLVADLAWHRLTDRVERLSRFNLHWPEDFAPGIVGWLVIGLLAGGALLVAIALRQQWKARHIKDTGGKADLSPLRDPPGSGAN